MRAGFILSIILLIAVGFGAYHYGYIPGVNQSPPMIKITYDGKTKQIPATKENIKKLRLGFEEASQRMILAWEQIIAEREAKPNKTEKDLADIQTLKQTLEKTRTDYKELVRKDSIQDMVDSIEAIKDNSDYTEEQRQSILKIYDEIRAELNKAAASE